MDQCSLIVEKMSILREQTASMITMLKTEGGSSHAAPLPHTKPVVADSVSLKMILMAHLAFKQILVRL